MFTRLAEHEARFETLETLRYDPAVLSDIPRLRKLYRERDQLAPMVTAFKAYREQVRQLEDAKRLLDDVEFASLAAEEVARLEPSIAELYKRLVLMLHADPRDEYGVILKLRQRNYDRRYISHSLDHLASMYRWYAMTQGWTVDHYYDYELEITGRDVFRYLKWERGTHCIRDWKDHRNPIEIHKDFITIDVIALADDINLELHLNEVRQETFKSTGYWEPWAVRPCQVRLVHLPTGIVSYGYYLEESCEKNYAAAKRALIAMLYNRQFNNPDPDKIIRTYDYTQNHMIDHRIEWERKKTSYNLESELTEVIQALIAHDEAAALEAAQGGTL